MEKVNKRFTDIDYAKGLAIILVVLGHVVARDFPEGNEWFIYVKNTIYMFHMAFFMFISGWVFYHVKPSPFVFDFVSERAYRLLLPFFLFAIIVILGKSIAANFLYVNNAVGNLQDAVKSVIWNTADSKANFIWYIYVLFVFNVVTLFFLAISKNKLYPLLILSFILTFVRPPQIMYFDYICKYYFFFVLGCFMLSKKDKYFNIIDKYSFGFLIIFIIFASGLSIILSLNIQIPLLNLYFLVGLSSVPAIHSLLRSNFTINKMQFLEKIGKYCLTIYLFNVIFIGLTKGIMLKFISWNYFNFLIFLPVLFCAGIFLPIIFWDNILSKIPIINKITI